MSTRYIQAAVTEEEYDLFVRFAGANRISISSLIGDAVKEYIQKRKEEENKLALDLKASDGDPLNP